MYVQRSGSEGTRLIPAIYRNVAEGTQSGTYRAMSCPCSTGGGYSFATMDGAEHYIPEWDLLIAHPPCTYLSNAGAVRLFPNGVLNQDRYAKGLQGKDFFMRCLNADCKRIAVENPVPTRIYGLPPYTQTIQPYEYGHPYSKKTCLWLKGLPPLRPTKIITDNIISWVKGGSKDKYGRQRKRAGTTYKDSKMRSKTFEGIAAAMAEQWGEVEVPTKTFYQVSIFDILQRNAEADR